MSARLKTIGYLAGILVLGIGITAISGCAGTALLKEPVTLEITEPLAEASDDRVAFTLDWVIVRDGPGSWARNADWDEYLLRVRNLSAEPLEVTGVTVTDLQEVELFTLDDRGDLVDASRDVVDRYENTNVEIKAGLGTGTMLAAAGAVSAVGLGAMAATTTWGGTLGAMSVSGPSALAVGVFVAGPALAIGGLVKWRNRRAVNEEIGDRSSVFPVTLEPGAEHQLDLFYPLAPSPRSLTISYRDDNGAHDVNMSLASALDGLHIQTESE